MYIPCRNTVYATPISLLALIRVLSQVFMFPRPSFAMFFCVQEALPGHRYQRVWPRYIPRRNCLLLRVLFLSFVTVLYVYAAPGFSRKIRYFPLWSNLLIIRIVFTMAVHRWNWDIFLCLPGFGWKQLLVGCRSQERPMWENIPAGLKAKF